MLNPIRKPISGNGALMTMLATAFYLKQGADVLQLCPVDGKTADEYEDFFEKVIDGVTKFQTIKHSQIEPSSVVKNVDTIDQLRTGREVLINLVTSEAIQARKVMNLPLALVMEEIILDSVCPPKEEKSAK